MTGLDALTEKDIRAILSAKTSFQADLGPTSDFVAFRHFTGDPYTDATASANFIVYFFDGNELQPADTTAISKLLRYALHLPVNPELRAFEKYGPSTILQVHASKDGEIDRGFAAIDLATARPTGLDVLMDSLLREALSLPLLKSDIASDWVDYAGTLKEAKKDIFRDYISFIYCTDIARGTTASDVMDRIRRLSP